MRLRIYFVKINSSSISIDSKLNKPLLRERLLQYLEIKFLRFANVNIVLRSSVEKKEKQSRQAMIQINNIESEQTQGTVHQYEVKYKSCQICNKRISGQDAKLQLNCNHSYHQNCLIREISSQIQQQNVSNLYCIVEECKYSNNELSKFYHSNEFKILNKQCQNCRKLKSQYLLKQFKCDFCQTDINYQ